MTEGTARTFVDMVLQSENPSSQDPDTQFDLPGNSLFRDATQTVMGPNATKGKAVELAYNSFSKVFVLWRPWKSCERCRQELEDDENEDAVLPVKGDYTCPHTQETDFKNVRDKILRGEAIRDQENFFFTADGERCVHILWLEPNPDSLRQLKKMERLRKQMSNIHPHDPGKTSS